MSNIDTQLLQLLIPLIILQIVLMVSALISCIKQPTTRGPKWLWFLLIIFASLLGPILYFIVGKKEQ